MSVGCVLKTTPIEPLLEGFVFLSDVAEATGESLTSETLLEGVVCFSDVAKATGESLTDERLVVG